MRRVSLATRDKFQSGRVAVDGAPCVAPWAKQTGSTVEVIKVPAPDPRPKPSVNEVGLYNIPPGGWTTDAAKTHYVWSDRASAGYLQRVAAKLSKDQAADLWEKVELLQGKGAVLGPLAFSALISAFCRYHAIDLIWHALSTASWKGIRITVPVSAEVVLFFARRGEGISTLRLLASSPAHMKLIVVEGLGRAGRGCRALREAIPLLRAAEVLGVKVSPKAVVLAMSGCKGSAEMEEYIRRCGLPPEEFDTASSSEARSAAAWAFVRSGEYAKACEVLGDDASPWGNEALVRGLMDSNRVFDAFAVWVSLVERGEVAKAPKEYAGLLKGLLTLLLRWMECHAQQGDIVRAQEKCKDIVALAKSLGAACPHCHRLADHIANYSSTQRGYS